MVTQLPPYEPNPPGEQQPQPVATNRLSTEQIDSVWEDVAVQRTPSSPGNVIKRKEVPASLRPGEGAAGVGFGSVDEEDNVWNEARNQSLSSTGPDLVPGALRHGVNRSETNPFLRKKMESETSANPLPEPFQPPVQPLSKLGLDEANNQNPWQAAGETQNSLQLDKPPILVLPNDSETDAWARSTPEPPLKEIFPPKSPDLISLHSEGSAWDADSPSENDNKNISQQSTTMPDEFTREQQVWDDLGASDVAKGKGKVPDLLVTQTAQLDDWSLIDSDPSSSPPKQAQETPEETQDSKPPLPPRLTGDQARWTPSRAPIDGKAETYQVKNIRWTDPSSPVNPRISPILIQNENGPCPLVALVNALTLTTPTDIPDTALVQVLRSREQVSLSLLLDAVFDELMSPRRTSSEDSLPDVGDLYAFLQSLHTGMNVNPRFIPAPEVVAAYKRTSLTHLHPIERGNLIPGTFENTMEMGLYATFSIPLIHGWLPVHDDPVYAALEKHAVSYEDVQNLLFREEELEDKLSNSQVGLTEPEQDLYQDIITIKMFMNDSATQLTPFGIDVISKAMRPGTFAILFRNDHFSTLYCHPQTMQLLSLVTDAGYRSHEEVVWESLRDVHGELNEFLSGDFRITSGSGEAGSSTDAPDRNDGEGGAWSTVTNKRGKTRAHEDDAPMSPNTEQEDRDLALALQLQEEEDQRHREEQARRQRERQLSEQYIEQQAHQPTPVSRNTTSEGLAPQRRSSTTVNIPVTTTPRTVAPTQQQVRSLVPPRRPGVNRPANSEDEPPPPSYEQAAQVPAYVPPPGHPNHPTTNQTAARRASRSGAAAGAAVNPGPVAAGRGQRPMPAAAAGGRRQPVPPSAVIGSQNRGDRDCVVM